MTTETFDLVIIGGGPGGYVTAIRAAQLGMTVACVEMRGALGGTCLNVGCIPSKALLHSSELFAESRDHFSSHGIEVKPKLNLGTMMKRKEKTVEDLTKGIEYLFKKNKVTYIQGKGVIKALGQVEVVEGKDKGKSLEAKNIIIATGSVPASIPNINIDEKDIVSSTGALSFDEIPKKLTVVGAGVIGLELGSVWQRLGSEVTVVEFLNRICPTLDAEIAKNLKRTLTKQGLKFKLSKKVVAINKSKSTLSVDISPAQGDGAGEVIECDKVLIATGRKPFTDGLGLENIGVELDARGFIPVDENFATTAQGVYAIGDCVPGPMLAHKAEEEGVVCVERLNNIPAPYHPHLIPGVIYTSPEVADIGESEESLKEKGIEYKVGSFPLSANSRARANSLTDGLVKIITDAATDQILGGHIIAFGAGEMIHELAAVMAFGGSAEDVARICHAHPTFSESVKEAALAVGDGAIHS